MKKHDTFEMMTAPAFANKHNQVVFIHRGGFLHLLRAIRVTNNRTHRDGSCTTEKSFDKMTKFSSLNPVTHLCCFSVHYRNTSLLSVVLKMNLSFAISFHPTNTRQSDNQRFAMLQFNLQESNDIIYNFIDLPSSLTSSSC